MQRLWLLAALAACDAGVGSDGFWDQARADDLREGEAALAEHNGINCTPGTSPCTTHRVAVFRVTEDITGPVHVTVVAKSAVPGGGAAHVTVRRDDGWVRSVRYRAALGI